MGAVNGNDGDKFGDFQTELTNLEKSENKESAERKKSAGGFQKFDMVVYKPKGLTKIVGDEAALEEALAQGWIEDVRDLPVEDADGDGVPDRIFQMTVDQAARAVKTADAATLAEYELDEQRHGNREQVIALIDAAKDAVSVPASDAKPAKPAKADKADKPAKADKKAKGGKS